MDNNIVWLNAIPKIEYIKMVCAFSGLGLVECKVIVEVYFDTAASTSTSTLTAMSNISRLVKAIHNGQIVVVNDHLEWPHRALSAEEIANIYKPY